VRERKNKEGKIGERGRIRGKPTSIELVALLGPITQEKIEEKGRKGKKSLALSSPTMLKKEDRKERDRMKREDYSFVWPFINCQVFLTSWSKSIIIK